MNSGDKMYLKIVTQTQEVIVGGRTTTEVVEIGAVVRARPGPRIDGIEYIALVVDEGEYRWNDLLSTYDPETIDDDPANESRWVKR